MPRTDNDSWAITESVGATALGVAAARAAETESDNPLINDPFARIFVDAAGDGIWSMYTNRTLLAGATDLDPDLRAPIQQMIDFMAARTAFFDEYFLATADAGVRQVVILASGLDSRAWRLPWPDGTVVYELDQAQGAGIQISHVAPAWRAAGFAAGERSHRPSSGLAKGTAESRI